MADWPVPGYSVYSGSSLDRALLLKFMHLTYRELYPEQSFEHLALTVERYLSSKTPIWWVAQNSRTSQSSESNIERHLVTGTPCFPVACLWMGSATDQVEGDSIAYIFLIYVAPPHRRQGIAAALIAEAEIWVRRQGDRKISLQVFSQNQPALNLYQKLGYQVKSMTLQKSLL
ncbi:MAG: GNAT family N-acetyltransferase [Microcoleaceae cyanobacterium]